MLLSIASFIRVFADEIPQDWLKTREKLKEKREEAPQDAIKERAQGLKNKAVDKIPAKPSLFLRDTNSLIKYVDTSVMDPKKHGLKQILVRFVNDFRLNEPRLPKEFQVEVINMASELKDSGELIEKIKKLFSEEHDTGRPPKKAVWELLRKLAHS